MTLSTRHLPLFLLALTVAAVPVWANALSGKRWERCADPEALLDVSGVAGTRSVGEIVLRRPGAVFAALAGELEKQVWVEPLSFRLVRSDDATLLYNDWARWLRVPMDPDRLFTREELVAGERVTVRVATAALAHTLQLAVYLFVYDGRPVDSLLPRQIRTSFAQAVKGTMPLTFYIVGGRVPKHRASEAQDAAVEWVLAAWRHHRQVCRP
ncbi:MAG: hypothetical protein V3U03_14860 [Myxococcota bacterium]